MKLQPLLLAALLLLPGAAPAAEDLLIFRDAAQEQEYRHLTESLRCPKCQNNSIADSDALIAADLRQKVYELLQDGRSAQEITGYMVARYGHFVTYDPPLTPLTVFLWLLPVLAAGAGVLIIIHRPRRGKKTASPRPSGASRSAAVQPADNGRRAGKWFYLPGMAAALLLSAFSYEQTGSREQVRQWQAAEQALPGLLVRLNDPSRPALNAAELKTLALGLRTRLETAPQAADWRLLGDIETLLDAPRDAAQAYGRAYAAQPENSAIALAYAKGLVRSPDKTDKARAVQLLTLLLQDAPEDIPLLTLLTVSLSELEQFADSRRTGEKLLHLLPADSPRRALVEKLLAAVPGKSAAEPAVPVLPDRL